VFSKNVFGFMPNMLNCFQIAKIIWRLRPLFSPELADARHSQNGAQGEITPHQRLQTGVGAIIVGQRKFVMSGAFPHSMR
jgi:hypothetical protein